MVRKKSIRRSFLLALLVSITICWLGYNIRAVILNRQKILFEVSLRHNGLRTNDVGFYISDQGNIFGFGRNASKWESIANLVLMDVGVMGSRGRPPYSTNQLFKRYGFSSTLIGTIDSDTLDQMVRLIEPASLGEIVILESSRKSEPSTDIFFEAFIYSERSEHTPVLLHRTRLFGESQENTSLEAQSLYTWLQALCTKTDYIECAEP